MATTNGWKNKSGTAERECKCGSWKQHWINFSGKKWPERCSVLGYSATPTIGAHVINPAVTGEKIIPMCASCNKITGSFNIKSEVTLVSANKSKTCDK